MRYLKSTLLIFVAYTCGAQQFSITPQIGLENSLSSLRFNNENYASPAGRQTFFQPGVTVNYKSHSGHGLFAGISTDHSVVPISFTDAEATAGSYKISSGNLRMVLNGGYQFSFKPISLQKKSLANSKSSSGVNGTHKNCAGYTCYHHCNKSGNAAKTNIVKNRAWNMRIQPFIGMAYVPGTSSAVETKSGSYVYNSGNWKTAIISGASFGFAKGRQQKFSINLNYTKGIGNFGSSSVTTASAGKTTVIDLRSTVSKWSLTAGIPFSLSKRKPTVKQVPQYKAPENAPHQWRCGQYHHNCG